MMRGARIRSIEPKKYLSINEMNRFRWKNGCKYFSVRRSLIEYVTATNKESAVTIYL